MPTLWPHQQNAISQVKRAIDAGYKRILLCIPTGGGKSLVAANLIEGWLEKGLETSVFTNRRMLVDQLAGVLSGFGLESGIRAAGHQTTEGLLQISMIQTEVIRAKRAKQSMAEWVPHPAKRVIVDEAHIQTGPETVALLDKLRKDGAVIVGLTATPIGLGLHYDHLIQCGLHSELRDCGALVPCRHYGPDEPDLRRLKKLQEGVELTQSQARQAMCPSEAMRPKLWGRVWHWFEKLNPEHNPSILFAPGIPESVWFAQQFTSKGVRAAHIDGNHIWLDGEQHEATPEMRAILFSESESGRLPVICNRFVLREGIDAPWLAHGIFATVFGSCQTYLQSGGRLLRAHPSLDYVTVQDHGGNWWRHGSLNANRTWHLDDTETSVYGVRAQKLRAKRCEKCFFKPLEDPRCPNCGFWNEREPASCADCKRVLVGGKCPECGKQSPLRMRSVVTADGDCIEMQGDIFKPRRISKRPGAIKAWERMYWRARSPSWNATFSQAFALYCAENYGGWPDTENWPLMPTIARDFFRRVSEVPMSSLRKDDLTDG